MTRREIKKISQKLGLKIAESKFVVKKLTKSKLITGYEDFLRICVNSKNPSDRWQSFIEFMFKSFEGDIVNTTSTLLRQSEPCFEVLALFNINDIWRAKGKKFIDTLNKEERVSYKRLLDYPIRLPKDPKVKWELSDDPSPYSKKLCHKFIDLIIRNYINKYRNRLIMQSLRDGENIHVFPAFPPDIFDILTGVLDEVGVLAFNIEIFNDLLSLLYFHPFQAGKEKLEKITKALTDPFQSRTEITKIRYWLIYALIEKLKARRYGVRESFKKASELIKEPHTSIHRRYYDRKKVVKKEKLSLNDIIIKYHLNNMLNNLLTRLPKKRA